MNCYGIKTADILLPNKGVDLTKWAVVACDQYTSEKEYWNRIEEVIGDAPSTLKLIQPEAFLGEGDNTEKVNAEMEKYLSDGTLETAVKDGFVLVERETQSGKRIGLVVALDLDEYDFTGKANSLTRATEQTVASRIPPRVKIRKDAAIELPHVMVLVDDKNEILIEAVYKKRDGLRKLYDFELLERGGRIKGWAVEGKEEKECIKSAIEELYTESDGFLYAVGDGNHSLATAKTCWENIKESIPVGERENHPARYALVELVNLYSPALIFEPIHRVIFGANGKALVKGFKEYLEKEGAAATSGTDVQFVYSEEKISIGVSDKKGRMPLKLLQEYLDIFVAENNAEIDYIHGDDVTVKLGTKEGNVGILLEAMKKENLFSYIKAGGSLPRKTFSMGEANEKRFYLEAKKIKR